MLCYIRRGKTQSQPIAEAVYDEALPQEIIPLETNTCYQQNIKLELTLHMNLFSLLEVKREQMAFANCYIEKNFQLGPNK